MLLLDPSAPSRRLSDQMARVNFLLDENLAIAVICLFAGKSNFMDAISFVFGEQARSLRVKKLHVRQMF